MNVNRRTHLPPVLLTAVWLILAVLSIRRNWLWTPLAIMGVVAGGAGWRQIRRQQPALAQEGLCARPVISPPLEAASWRALFQLACAGALIQAAVALEGSNRAVAAGVFAGAASAFVLSRVSPAQIEHWLHRRRRVSFALALFLTLVSLVQPGAGRWRRAEPGYWAADAESNTQSANDISFKGVILYVEKKADRIVAPPPRALLQSGTDPSREPLVIPFSGVYWFLRAPDRLPPVSSLLQHGSPDQLFYRVAEQRPLTMEAHQHLGRLVDIGCCFRLGRSTSKCF